MKKYLIFLLLFTISLTFFVLKQAVVAQEINWSYWAQILIGENNPGILPTSPFYFLREWGRDIKKFFTFDSIKKVELELQYADEKLIEAAKVIDENCGESSECNVRALEKAFNNYLSSQERLKERLESLSGKNQNVSELISKTTERVVLHQALFDELVFLAKTRYDSVNNSIRNIKRVGSSGDEFEQVIKNFDEKLKKNKIDVIEGIGKLRMNKTELIDAVAKGSIKAVEKLPYADGVKELKALEILTRIEEKLPEEAKKIIENTKENIENKLLEEKNVQSLKNASSKIRTIRTLEGNVIIQDFGSQIVIDNVPLNIELLSKFLDELEEKTKNNSSFKIESIKQLKDSIKSKITFENENTGEFSVGPPNFKIEIDGIIQGEFKEISGIESDVEVVEYKDGDDLARRRPDRAKYSNIVLKRGSVTDTKLYDWYKGGKKRTTISIIILDRAGQEVGRYNLFDAFPVKFEGGDYSVEEIEFRAEGGVIIGKKVAPDKMESGSEQIRVPVACPLIAPDISKGKEECLKAAKHLDEIYPGCNYAKTCEEISKEKPSLDCGPAPGAPGNWRCIDGAWKDISQCGKIYCFRYDPVCGTDGKTYSCGEIDAQSCGVEVAYRGECKKEEFPSPPVSSGQVATSSASAPAQKLPQPIFCTQEWNPVCGKDGKTYSNECMAKAAGIEIKYRGECLEKLEQDSQSIRIQSR